MPTITRPLARPLTLLLALFVLGPLAAAQGMVQLRFAGALDVERGHLVEVEIVEADTERELVLHIHLAAGTTGAELAQLVARRAERAGISLTAPQPVKGEGSLFVDAASKVRLRLGGGLVGEISCTEGAPSLVRVLPPSAIAVDGRVNIVGSSAVVTKDRPPIRRRAEFSAAVTPKMDAPATATALWKAGAERWMSERPGSDGWRPIKFVDGGVLTGVSARVEGPGDWRLEVSLD